MFRQPAIKQHNFSHVPAPRINRSSFNRTHKWMGTIDADYLYPFYVDEVMPADTHKLRSTIFGRLNTPIVPIMDNLFLDTFYFFIPYRLIQTNFVKMMGEQANPGDSISYLAPSITSPAGGWTLYSLFDYAGLPLLKDVTHTNYFGRAYNATWNAWFRDENLQNSAVVDLDDGPDTNTDYVLLKRGKRFDYFTSCLTSTQKGSAVSLPLGTSAPVLGIGAWGSNQVIGNTAYESVSGQTIANTAYGWGGASTYNQITIEDAVNSSGTAGASSHIPYVRADLTNATAATITALRQAIQLQSFYERDFVGGTRYVESVMSHFGCTDPLALVLSRPEYLGGSTAGVNIHPVAQTSGTSASGTTTPLGNLAAMGTVVCDSGFTKSFTEHGIIIGLMSVRAELVYQQGLDKMFTRGLAGRFDFYYPSFANISEQPVYNKEIYYNNDANDNLVFGYNEAFADLRFKRNTVTSLLRSQAASSIDIWHLAQEFSSLPTLNSTFIQSNTDIDRVIATPSQPQFIIDCHNELLSVRAMPTWGVPSSLLRF